MIGATLAYASDHQPDHARPRCHSARVEVDEWPQHAHGASSIGGAPQNGVVRAIATDRSSRRITVTGCWHASESRSQSV